MDSNPLFTLGLGLTPPWRVALSFAREMPVATAATLIGITDQRLWRS